MITTAAPVRKRLRSMAFLNGLTKGGGGRASKACQYCRFRRIRCDAIKEGIPCTNCKWHEKECVLAETKRGKRHRVINKPLELRSQSSTEQSQEYRELFIRPVTGALGGQDPVDVSNQSDILDIIEPGLPVGLPFCQPRNLSWVYPDGFRNRSADLPDYISPLPSWITSADRHYLRRKGAFIVPGTELRDALLHSYTLFVHPFLPVIDLGDFFMRFNSDSDTKSVSLMLLQAAMFAAVAYVDIRILNAHGYDSRREARKYFFDRVKLLYSFDCEADPVTVVQTVLLMTLWYEGPDEIKDAWYYVGIAVSLARSIDLDRVTEVSRGLWKRIWWSCYMRDRIVAITMRRPLRIREDEFDIPMLEFQDFDINSWPNDVSWMSGSSGTFAWGSENCLTLVKLCIALAECCRCISHILGCHYVAAGSGVGATQETTIRLAPRCPVSTPCAVMDCDAELDAWYKALPSEIQWSKQGVLQQTLSLYNEALLLHSAILNGVYLAAKSALHRPLLVFLQKSSELRTLSESRVRGAAMNIMDIFHTLDATNLTRYVSDTGVAVLQPAIVTWLRDMKSSSQPTREAGLQHLQFCTQFLKQLRDVSASADSVSLFLTAAAHKVGVWLEEAHTIIPSHIAEGPVNVSMATQQGPPMTSVASQTLSPKTKVTRQYKDLMSVDAGTSILSCFTMTPQEQVLFTALSTPSSPSEPVHNKDTCLSLSQTHNTEALPLLGLSSHGESDTDSGIENRQYQTWNGGDLDRKSVEHGSSTFPTPAEDAMWSEFCVISNFE